MLPKFRPGEIWLDTAGQPIQAHGGSILFEQGVYYWFGENKNGTTYQSAGELHRVDVIGIACYSSRDLYHWQNEGVVLPAVQSDPDHDLHPGKVVERPKVIFNASTGNYVMWVHVDHPDYSYARIGVATSRHPTGPYHYQGSFRPAGTDSRDMTIFQDANGRAYLIFSSDWNSTLKIVPLTADFCGATDQVTAHFPGAFREAPAVFSYRQRYYMVTSGCTGWMPNPALYATADQITGSWKMQGNPCVGDAAEQTFFAQSTYILPLPDKPQAFIFMADRWQPENLSDSRYVWLPLEMVDGQPVIRWHDEWDLSIFDR